MKNLVVTTIVFVASLFIFGIELPVVQNSPVIGTFVASFVYVAFRWAVSWGLAAIFLALIGITVVAGGEDAALLVGCFSLIVGFVAGFTASVLFLMNGHNYLAWFPVYSNGQAIITSIITGLFTLSVSNSSKSNEE